MIAIKQLIAGQMLTAVAATYYTAPTNGTTLIKKLTFCNTSATLTLQITLYLVPFGGGAADNNAVIKSFGLSPLQSYEAYVVENHVLPQGAFIQAFASTAALVTIAASGLETT